MAANHLPPVGSVLPKHGQGSGVYEGFAGRTAKVHLIVRGHQRKPRRQRHEMEISIAQVPTRVRGESVKAPSDHRSGRLAEAAVYRPAPLGVIGVESED